MNKWAIMGAAFVAACSSSKSDDTVTNVADSGAHAVVTVPVPGADGGPNVVQMPDSGLAAADGGDGGDAASSSSSSRTLPYMVGIKTNGVSDGPAKVEAWLGRPIDVAGTTITTDSYVGNGDAYVTASGAYPLLEVSFPLLSIFGEKAKLTDMGEAAAGAYDSTYTAMAVKLSTLKNPLLSVRIGWEFSGNWYPWSNGVGPNATYANFVAAFERAAAIVKAKNPNVLVQWCIAWGQPDPTPYWPGAYDASSNPGGVDVVSIDFYQANISHFNDKDMTSPWSLAQSVSATSGPIVVDWMVAFAEKENVKMALSEYGAGQLSSKGIGSGAGLDDGTWTADSITWASAQPPGLLLWMNWSDDEPADDIVTAGANPKEQSAWKSAWAGTKYGGTWWKGAAPP